MRMVMAIVLVGLALAQSADVIALAQFETDRLLPLQNQQVAMEQAEVAAHQNVMAANARLCGALKDIKDAHGLSGALTCEGRGNGMPMWSPDSGMKFLIRK